MYSGLKILPKQRPMEIVGQLQKQFVDFSTSLYREGFLDEQYLQLQKLQDESNPDFVCEVISLFFEDSEKLLNNLATALQEQVVDFKQVDAHVHQFKGSSSSIGAQRVKNVCVSFRDFCEGKNLEGNPTFCLLIYSFRKNWHVLINAVYRFSSKSPFGFKIMHVHIFRCLRSLQQVKHEYFLVKNKLETLFRLERQILEAGGTVPTIA